jgi:outer membrane protein OmpA-like peptidoglycan-associated protein
MKNHSVKLIGIALLPGFLACAHAPPSDELLKAREAYSTAESGPATSLDPADLHEARVALDHAEAISTDDPQSPEAKQASYLALRRAELADAQGKTVAAAKAREDYVAQERQLKDDMLKRTQGQLAASSAQNQQVRGELAATQGQLASANQQEQQTAEQLQAEHDARVAAESKAMDALAKLGAVKNDERGMVLTLSGSVVFASNKTILLPGAQKRLDDVANALRDSPRSIRVEGHTDSRGSDSTNQDLSQRRAEAVMNYLVSRDIPANRITAVGLGSSRPVADNATAEGRANNRRVEIILLKDGSVSATN